MNLFIIGASGHARVVIDAIRRSGEHEIVGLIAEQPQCGSHVSGFPVLGTMSDLPELCESQAVDGLLVGVGDNWRRGEIARTISEMAPAFPFATAAHPSAQIAADVEIGPGTVVMAGAVVNSGSRIGRHCIVNTMASIDHDCVIGDCVSIAPGATLGGNVHVGDFSFVGLGAAVIHGLSVGEHTVVGAGSAVVRDLPACVVAYGVPVRVKRTRVPGERYL